MSSEEVEIWEEKASLRDFMVNPIRWILTIGTMGLYLVVVYLIRLSTRYTLTSERLKVSSGLFSKQIDEVELFRIKDTKVEQSFLNRLVGVGHISVTSTDQTHDLKIKYLPKAVERREEIRSYANSAREEKGIRTIVNE